MKLFLYYSFYGFSNTYFLGNDESGEALLVDPAEITTTIIGQIENKGYTLNSVLITHNHLHHVRGIKTLLKIYPVDIFSANAQILGNPCHPLSDGEIFTAAGFRIEVLSMPGHSPDSIVYRIGSMLFTGDALHAGLIGRTLSPFNSVALANRLRKKILELSDETMVFPGHGPPTTVGTERRFNVGLEPQYAQRVSSRYDFFV